MIRWILGAIVCLVVGVMFITEYYTGIPTVEQLTPVEGTVIGRDVEIRRSRRSKSQVLAVRIGEAPAAYYPERFPDFEQVVGTLKVGDRVKARVDVGQHNYIWQLDRDGEQLVSYPRVAEAQRTNGRNKAMLGGLFVLVGLGILGAQFQHWRKGAPQPQGDPS